MGRAAKFQFRAQPSQMVSEPARAQLFLSFFCVTLTSQRAEPKTSRAKNEPSLDFICIVTSQIVNLRAKRSPSRALAELFGIFSIGVTSRAEPGSVPPLFGAKHFKSCVISGRPIDCIMFHNLRDICLVFNRHVHYKIANI